MLKKEIYNSVWFFYKKYVEEERTEDFWEKVNKEANEILKKYKGDLFCRELLGTVMNELERK